MRPLLASDNFSKLDKIDNELILDNIIIQNYLQLTKMTFYHVFRYF